MVAGPRNHFVIDKGRNQDSGLFIRDRWRTIHPVAHCVQETAYNHPSLTLFNKSQYKCDEIVYIQDCMDAQ